MVCLEERERKDRISRRICAGCFSEGKKSMTSHGHIDDFDVSKVIFEKLKDLPPERQQRVLRWVAEGLGIAPSHPVASPMPMDQMASPLPSPHTTQPLTTSVTDIKSFAAAKNPKSDNQFAAVVAYYYRFVAPPAERRETIDGHTLQNATRLADHKRLASPRMTLHNAKNAGYLDGVSRGEFAINSVGENLVAMTLPGGGETRAGQARKLKSKSKRKSVKGTRHGKGA